MVFATFLHPCIFYMGMYKLWDVVYLLSYPPCPTITTTKDPFMILDPFPNVCMQLKGVHSLSHAWQSCKRYIQVQGWRLDYLEFHFEWDWSRLCLVNLWLVVVLNKIDGWLPIVINVVSNGKWPKHDQGYVTKTNPTCRTTMTKCNHFYCKPMTTSSHQKHET